MILSDFYIYNNNLRDLNIDTNHNFINSNFIL